jgi:hypothetical protein
MEIIGTLNEIAAIAHREVDRARINGYEFVGVSVGPYEAKVLCRPDAIFGEAVSNVLLAVDEALSPTQERRLELLGWARPDDRFQPFFHRTWSTGTASETLVRDLLTAFICVAGLEEGEQVACEVGEWCGNPGTRCAWEHAHGDPGEDPPGSGDWGPPAA